jgi:hypothetical protein
LKRSLKEVTKFVKDNGYQLISSHHEGVPFYSVYEGNKHILEATLIAERDTLDQVVKLVNDLNGIHSKFGI